jgi:hypothetical protein
MLETGIILAEFAIIAALVVLLIVRQVKGQYMDRRRLWGIPIILAVVGAIYVPLTVTRIVHADLLLTALGLVIAIGIGLGLGALTSAAPAEVPDRRGRTIVVRSGWKGGALWVVFILARLALQPVAAATHAHLVTSAGVALILVAIARAAMAIVVAPRLARAEATAGATVPSGAGPSLQTGPGATWVR